MKFCVKTAAAALALVLLQPAALSSCTFITINKLPDGTPVETTAITLPEAPETTPQQVIETETFAEIDEIDVPSPSGEVKPVDGGDNFDIAKKYLAALTDRSLEGVAVNIISTDSSLFAPSSNSSDVDGARLERNGLIEEKYDTKILAEQKSASTILDEAYLAVNSGDYYADLIAVPQSKLGSFVSKGLLLNLNSLPFTDYTAPYYDYNAMLQTAAGYKIYGAMGELNMSSEYYWCVYYNKSLIRELGADDPATLAYDGGWTWDAFRKMTLEAASLGVYGHGSSVDLDGYIDTLYSSLGNSYFITGVGRTPAQKAVKTSAETMISTIRSLIYGDGTVYDGGTLSGKYSTDGVRGAFYDGRLLFYIDRTDVMSWFTDMSDDWGIVPLPKLSSSSQYYYSYCDMSMPVICVLKNSPTVEAAGLYLQAAMAASYGFIEDVWYDTLTRDTIRSSDVLNMLDIVLARSSSGRSYVDFALIFGQGYSYIADATYVSLRTSVKTSASYTDAVNSIAPGLAKKMAADFPL